MLDDRSVVSDNGLGYLGKFTSFSKVHTFPPCQLTSLMPFWIANNESLIDDWTLHSS